MRRPGRFPVQPLSGAGAVFPGQRRMDQPFLQTIVILPIVVTGMSMIVLNSRL